MRLSKHWERFRSRRLATLALEEQLDSHRSAFYAGAFAATAEMVGVPRNYATASADRDRVVDELIDEIELDRQARGEHV